MTGRRRISTDSGRAFQESRPFGTARRNPEFQYPNLMISIQEAWGSVPSEGTPGGPAVGCFLDETRRALEIA
jgi:hypothetical protein